MVRFPCDCARWGFFFNALTSVQDPRREEPIHLPVQSIWYSPPLPAPHLLPSAPPPSPFPPPPTPPNPFTTGRTPDQPLIRPTPPPIIQSGVRSLLPSPPRILLPTVWFPTGHFLPQGCVRCFCSSVGFEVSHNSRSLI